MQNKWNNLRNIREIFDWTQEELSEEIGVAVSTISRWERRKTREPVISSISRKTNRRLTYVRAMIDPEAIHEVENSSEFGGLFHGEDLMLAAVSKGAAAQYPLVRGLVGLPVRGILIKSSKSQLDEVNDKIIRLLETNGITAKWVTHSRAGGPFVIPSQKCMDIYSMGGGVLKMFGRDAEDGDGPPRVEFYFSD